MLPAPLLPCLALLALTPLPPCLHLADALARARAARPQLQQADADVAVADAGATAARAGLWPQLSGGATYSKSTANFVLSPGALPSSAAGAAKREESSALHDFWALQLGAQQLVFDFAQTPRLAAAAGADLRRARATRGAAAQQVDLDVRLAFFAARAQAALAAVAEATLANQRRHCEQVLGFIRAGTRAEIDLAQARADVANARVQQIVAAHAAATARVQLNVAMGVEADIAYAVADDAMAELAAEHADLEALVADAQARRPDLQALEQALAGQRSRLGAARSAYLPSLSLGASATERGPTLQELTWNYAVNATLSWQLFSGGGSWAEEAAARATLAGLLAERAGLRQQVRLAVSTAVLQVDAGHQSVAAAEVAQANARLRLAYAEGRYQTDVGSIIELSDAQLALGAAEAQVVQAHFALATARAQLLQALGDA